MRKFIIAICFTHAFGALAVFGQGLDQPNKLRPIGAAEETTEVKGIVVLEALYGSEEQFEKGKAKNVTEIVKKHIVDGKLFIENNRETLGDPHPYKAKIFRMKYLRDGKPRTSGKPYEYESAGEIEVRR